MVSLRFPFFISQITCSSPSHPANSFYYPKLKILPPIAQVTMVKIKKNQLGLPVSYLHLEAKSNEITDSVSGKWLVLRYVIAIHSGDMWKYGKWCDETGDEAEHPPACTGIASSITPGKQNKLANMKENPWKNHKGIAYLSCGSKVRATLRATQALVPARSGNFIRNKQGWIRINPEFFATLK